MGTSEEDAVRRFNDRADAELRRALTACLDVPRWVEEVLAGRPYPSPGAVLATAAHAADPLTDEELHRALSHHPRIGDRPRGDAPEAELSRREQSGVDPSDAGTAERLRAGNLAYEQRFGHVFLIRAAGRSAEEILAALEERLRRAPAEEVATTAEQLRQIALLRLEGVLAA